jgi:hypothetical protein
MSCEERTLIRHWRRNIRQFASFATDCSTIRVLVCVMWNRFMFSQLPVFKIHSSRFYKLRKATISFVLSVRLSVRPSVRSHGTTRLSLDGFSWNLIFDCFSKHCREKASVIKIVQEWRVLYMKTNIYIFFILSRPFLHGMRNVSDKLCRENQNTHFMLNIFF